MKPTPQLALTVSLVLGSLISCGTQIGNPTGSGLVRVTDNQRALNSLLNASFMQTIDGINMGDYAYSNAETRVTTDRSCQGNAGSKLTLVDKAETKHAVMDESDEWSVKSDLSIKRSYQDAWTQNQKLLVCDPTTKALALDYRQMDQGPLRLDSNVDEDLNRKLVMTEKKLQQEVRHNLLMKKSGSRRLSLVNYSEGEQELSIQAELQNKLASVVTLNPAEEGAKEASMQLQDRFPLEFTIVLNQNRQWIRYEIANGRQEFLIPESGEVLRLEFKDLHFTRSSGCVPESGQLTATVLRPNLPNIRYSLVLAPHIPLLLKQDGGSNSLLLAPFACVLKER